MTKIINIILNSGKMINRFMKIKTNSTTCISCIYSLVEFCKATIQKCGGKIEDIDLKVNSTISTIRMNKSERSVRVLNLGRRKARRS